MKLLDVPEFAPINMMLNIETGDSHLQGRVEAFSCKMVKSDKSLLGSMARSPGPDPALLSISPFGVVEEPTNMKILSYLISTLNMSFPDYDFSDTDSRHFQKIHVEMVQSSVSAALKETICGVGAGKDECTLSLDEMWAIIDRQADLANCEAYAYVPPPDADPFQEEGFIWVFNYFFYNKKWKQIVFFTCAAVSDIHSPEVQPGAQHTSFEAEEFDLVAEDEDYIFRPDGMDEAL